MSPRRLSLGLLAAALSFGAGGRALLRPGFGAGRGIPDHQRVRALEPGAGRGVTQLGDDVGVAVRECPGGPSNGGTYYTLRSRSGVPLPLGEWGAVGASVDTTGDGSVTIEVYRDGAPVLTAVDSGTGCAPITAPGAVGVRGDNLDFNFRDFTVTELHPADQPAPVPGAQPSPAGSPVPGADPPTGAGGAGAQQRAGFALSGVSRRFRSALRLGVRTGGDVRRVTFRLGRRRVGADYDSLGGRVASRTIRVRYLGRR